MPHTKKICRYFSQLPKCIKKYSSNSPNLVVLLNNHFKLLGTALVAL